MPQLPKRLESLDILRGFDLFCLVALEGIVHPLAQAIDAPWFAPIESAFTHAQWEGLSPWDIVMPLFLFMAGVSIPFALSRFRNDRRAAYLRILRRVILLWILGMLCQGNLLGLDPNRVYLYSNTLQAIAAGYLLAAILCLHTGWRTQIAVSVSLLLAYWGAMEWITVGGYGGEDYSPTGNLAEWIDRATLGRFRDGAAMVNGEVIFASWYDYAWILCTPNFGVTTLTGVFAGYILKNRDVAPSRKILWLSCIGVGLIAAGYLWSPWLPIIKRIWTSSMVLVSSGWSFLLMALFYAIVDAAGWHRGLSWLKIYGKNSIVAYVLAMCVSFQSISHSLLYGLEQYTGAYYPAIVAAANAIILYQILRWMYHRQLFLRV